MTQPNIEDADALLTRLSQKPGVQSTLILSRESGAIVRTSVQNNVSLSGKATATGGGSTTRAEEVARLVWTFVEGATGLVNGLDGEDEMKLLRLRTKRNELVIVPDSKFLLVVIHETPQA